MRTEGLHEQDIRDVTSITGTSAAFYCIVKSNGLLSKSPGGIRTAHTLPALIYERARFHELDQQYAFMIFY